MPIKPVSPSRRVLIVHNLLWSHYKAALFGELHRLSRQSGGPELLVLQMARTERSRLGLGDPVGGEHHYPYHLLFDGALEDVGFWARAIALIKHTRRFRPDIVNLTGYYDPAQLVLLVFCKLSGIRTVLSTESNAFDHTRTGWKERIKKALIRQFDAYICFGSHSANYVLQLGARPDQILTNRAAVVNDAVLRANYQKAQPQRETLLNQHGLPPRNFIFVGRFTEVKNLDNLIAAFARAKTAVIHADQWGLILIGEGVLKEPLAQQAERAGLSSVHFLPGTEWFNVPTALAMADALILPSYSETWGLVVNEAMVCGLPVLVSDQCGCAFDLVREGENGFTFNWNDVDQLSRLLQSVMNAPTAIRQGMGGKSRQIIEAFSLKAVSGEIMSGYVKLAAEKAHHQTISD
ncbi:MAG: glycosyltransferase family 4 protein [Cytophagaceae bacterium]|nr:glycosyltransferase family 4 protein [Cytophagaceae bacterium]